MKRKEEVKPEENTDSILKSCPHCHSKQLWRIQRSESEKIICYLSNGKYAVKKYLCKACGASSLLRADNTPDTAKEILQVEKMDIAVHIPCPACGHEKLQITTASPVEENNYRQATGKKAFRKLTCLICNHEMIISTEDYLAANSNEV